jgi:hypothetical protein
MDLKSVNIKKYKVHQNSASEYKDCKSNISGAKLLRRVYKKELNKLVKNIYEYAEKISTKNIYIYK